MKSSIVTPKKVNNYEVYPKTMVAKNMVFHSMSSHYRRIYNAKPRVDTGPPFSHRPPQKIKPPLKNSPWKRKQVQSCPIPKKSLSATTMTNSTKCSRESIVEREIAEYTFSPQISKSDAESKVRTMRVYHPPRRRIFTSSSSISLQMLSTPEVSVPEIPWIQNTEEEKTLPCKGSYSDSAFTEEGEGVWSGTDSSRKTPVSESSERARSMDDLLYIKFVRGITEEVLRKGVYTNDALKKIFKSHINIHKQYLDERRMLQEVENLQRELGIPEDDKLDRRYIDYGLGYTTSTSSSANSEKVICSAQYEDRELLDALSLLNLSPSLKADIASSLGLYQTSHGAYSSAVLSVSPYSSNSSGDHKHSQTVTKRTTFSTPLEEIHDIGRKKTDKFNHQPKFPQSDDDSYELLSEGSGSRPATPLGLSW